MKSLNSDEILKIHFELVSMFEEENDPIVPPGPRDINLLHSAAARPQTSLGGTEKYSTPIQKAAALFHSLVTNHPFHNGNKRTALVSLIVYLDRAKILFEAGDDDLFDFVIAVADNRFVPPEHIRNSDEVVKAIADWVGKHTKKASRRSSGMDVSDFLKKCKKSGCRVRMAAKGGSWIIWGPNDASIRINKSTPHLTGSIVKNYLQKLGLSASISGVYYDEFQNGLNPEQERMRRFRNVLKRLAHA